MRRIFFALSILVSVPTTAEPVFVEAKGVIGQGWVVRERDVCIMITAAHVVEHAGGGTVYASGGLRGVFEHVVRHPDPAIDLALAWIEGPLKTQCPTSSLGYSDSRQVLSAARRERRSLSLDLVESSSPDTGVGSGQTRTIPVLVDTIDPAADYPTFQFVSAREDIGLLYKGDSGAVIRDTRRTGLGAGEPLGIVITEGEDTSAIRFDIARSFVRATLVGAKRLTQTEQSSSNTSRPIQLLDWSGDLPNPQCTPLNALHGTGCAMRLRPATGMRTTSVAVRLSNDLPIRRVRVTFEGPPTSPLTISTRPLDDSSWTPIRFCRPNALIVDCGLGSIAARDVEIKFAGEVYVRAITIE